LINQHLQVLHVTIILLQYYNYVTKILDSIKMHSYFLFILYKDTFI